MINLKIGAVIAVAFIVGAFVASPELRAYAANTVGSGDIINESILSADIKNGEVKASDIATDAVGAAELQGVTKLLFGQCAANSVEGTRTVPAGEGVFITCSINGVDSDDSAIAEVNTLTTCFEVYKAVAATNSVTVGVINDCKSTNSFGTGSKISIIVFDK